MDDIEYKSAGAFVATNPYDPPLLWVRKCAHFAVQTTGRVEQQLVGILLVVSQVKLEAHAGAIWKPDDRPWRRTTRVNFVLGVGQWLNGNEA